MAIHDEGRLSPARRGLVKAAFKAGIRILGKSGGKVAAIFASDPSASHAAAVYLSAGAPGIPLWLFTTATPRPETAALCGRVTVRSSSPALFLAAQARLWRHSVAISVGEWTGSRSSWLLKAAPLLVPPFRAVFLNENGDFLPGRPRHMADHSQRRMRHAANSAWHCALDGGRSACYRTRDYWRALTLWNLAVRALHARQARSLRREPQDCGRVAQALRLSGPAPVPQPARPRTAPRS